MKKIFYALAALCVLMLGSCRKDEMPVASDKTNDPFVRHDGPAEVDHTIYQLYQSSGVPVLYNDTLQRSPELALLNLGYTITGNNENLRIVYLNNPADILNGITFVKDSILSKLGHDLRPYSVLLTDSIYTSYIDYGGGFIYKQVVSSLLGTRSVAIGNIDQLATMTNAAKSALATEVITKVLTAKLKDRSELDAFYKVSAVYYGRPASGTVDNGYSLPYKPKGTYGFLPQPGDGSTSYRCPTKDDDILQYITAIVTISDAAFTAKYASYSLVMTKYKLVRNLLTAFHYNF